MSVFEKISETSGRTGIPEPHIRKMINIGVIPQGVWTRLGRRFYINRERLDEFLADGGAAFPGGWRQEPGEKPAEESA